MSLVESRDGTRIFYRVEGPAHSKRPGLLLCHPSFSSHQLWHLLVPELASERRVAIWDYRGHGRSEAPSEPGAYTLEKVQEDLEAVRGAAFGAVPVHLGGLSFGGTLAMQVALQHPERVRSLLLFNTGPGFRKPEALAEWRDMLERSADKFLRVGVAGYLEGGRARAELLGREADGERAAPLRRALLESQPAALAAFARGVAGPVPNLVDRLPEIRQPALVVVGEEDRAFQAASRVLEAKLPTAYRVEIPAAGHVANLDQPEAFCSAVRAHLTRQDPG